MKRGLLLIVAAMVLAGAMGGGVASAQEIAIVSVPFQFTVNQKVMTPGTYEITVTDASVISVMPLKGQPVFVSTITRLAQHGAPMANAEIVFDKAGENYTLAEVWLPTEDGYLVNDMKQPHQHHILKGTKKGT